MPRNLVHKKGKDGIEGGVKGGRGGGRGVGRVER